MNATINEQDLISMKLLHYLVTKKNYSPIIVQGVENEIWLQNLSEEYKVVRIVNNYIHNNEQLDFDVFKTKQMIKKIKQKTLTFNIKTLTILTDIGDNVDFNKTNNLKDISLVSLKSNEDLYNNLTLKNIYNDLADNIEDSEDVFQLFLKITTEINEKNRRDNMENEKLFKPKTIILNNIILGLLVLIYILGLVLNYSDALNYNFGLINEAVRDGQFYRLVTCIFLHGGLLHLLCNCYSLYIVGNQIENFYGKTKFIIIFLFSGITGSLLSLALGPNNAISIGASGAIFGLMGSLLYFGYYYRVFLGSFLTKSLIPIIILNLAIGFMSTGINNFGHIGGLIGGLLISMALGINKKDSKNRVTGIILSVLFVGVLLYLGLYARI